MQAWDASEFTENFYPRPPRGGRHNAAYIRFRLPKISIHALREEGDAVPAGCDVVVTISIHALREEGDLPVYDVYELPFIFLSTPSARRATTAGVHKVNHCGISIHALREEGDRRERRMEKVSSISIHALREEGDQTLLFFERMMLYFYPRPPRGGRLLRTNILEMQLYFYPRPPRGGRHR